MADEPARSRGGPQWIPRPPGHRLGGPPPWAGLPEHQRRPTVDDVRRALSVLGPPVPSPVEGTVKRASAVLAPIYEHEGQAYVVLTRRSQELRAHSGEVSFPGGGQDPEDEDLRATALREACEEIAMDPASVEIIGELDHLSTITSRSFIVPFVGILPGRPELRAHEREVEAILHVPLAELLLDEVWHEEHWKLGDIAWSIWFFELYGDTVWGATAAMLRQLLGFITGTVERGDMGHI